MFVRQALTPEEVTDCLIFRTHFYFLMKLPDPGYFTAPTHWVMVHDHFGKNILAVASYVDYPSLKQRLFQDFYRVQTKCGIKAMRVLADYISNGAYDAGLDGLFVTHGKNVSWDKTLNKHGSEIIGTIRRLPMSPRAKIKKTQGV